MSGDVIISGRIRGRRSASLLRNGLYNVGGQAVRGAAGLLTIPFLIRFLGIREYGVWSLAYAVLALMTLSEAGISVAAVVFLSKDFAKDDFEEAGTTLTFILVSAALLSIAVALFLWLAGPLVVRPVAAFESAERAGAGRAIQIAGFAVSALIPQRVLVGVEQAFDQYGAINILDIFQSFLLYVGLVVVAYLGGKTVVLMKWQAFACGLVLIAHCCFVLWLLRGKGLSFKWSGNKARRILRYSVATWITTLGSTAFSQCDRLIVGGVLGPSVLGIYSAITAITSRINLFSGTAVQPLLSSLSRDTPTNAPVERRIRQATYLNAFIVIEAGIFLYVLADGVMRVMAPGANAPQAILGLQIATIIYALYSMNAPGFYLLFAVGEARTNAVVTLSSSLVSLGLIFLGARCFGLMGALSGNAGYLGTLCLIISGLRRAGIALRRYLAWMAFPFLGLVVALLVGLFLQNHFWWRVGLVALQGVVFASWFLRAEVGAKGVRFDFGRVSEG